MDVENNGMFLYILSYVVFKLCSLVFVYLFRTKTRENIISGMRCLDMPAIIICIVSHFAASEPIGLDAELSDMQEDVILASEAGGPVDGPVTEQYLKSKPTNKLYMEHAGTHVLEAQFKMFTVICWF